MFGSCRDKELLDNRGGTKKKVGIKGRIGEIRG